MRNFGTVRKGRTVYQHGPRDNACNGILKLAIIFLLIGAVPFALFVTERTYRDLLEGFSEIEDDITPISENTKDGSIVHFLAGEIDATASDPMFDVSVPGSLELRRKTEYCQWTEHSSQRCETCHRTVKAKDGSASQESYSCNCVTEYHYTKHWRSYRVNSLLFDQPAAHHNPQRDPYPSQTYTATTAAAAIYHDGVPSSKLTQLDGLLKQDGVLRFVPWRRVNWVLGGMKPSPGFFERQATKWFNYRDHTRYESMGPLKDTHKSRAASSDGFYYVGQGGYFFSPYVSSQAELMIKYFFEYVEGSLMDWQLGDLMPSCTAGDIRVSYDVQDPETISVIGVVDSTTQSIDGGEQFNIQSIRTPKGHVVGLIHSGDLSAIKMMETEASSQKWRCIFARLVLLLWSIGLAYLFAALMGITLKTYQLMSSASLGIWGLSLGTTWMMLWGLEVDAQFHDLVTPLACLAGALLLVWTVKNAPPAKTAPGLHAVWCMVARAAQLPPSWRQEDTYLNARSKAAADMYGETPQVFSAVPKAKKQP